VTCLYQPPRLMTLRAIFLIVATTLFYPLSGLARNGDDWVLVQRFQSQQKQAQAGNAAAMYEVGRMYELGRGTEPNMSKAIQWYERALKKGQNNARAHLGILYFEGTGVNRDRKRAVSLLQPAAQAGSPTAQYYLGRMYEQGEGLRRDPNQAIYWYKKAADSGYYMAVARLKDLEKHRSSRTRARATPQTARPKQNESPATILLQTVVNAKWQRNGRPAGFLPSVNSSCKRKSELVVNCQSGEQQRNIGDAIITYVTEATLYDFNNADQFEVKYSNNVHKIQPVARPSIDGETPAVRAPPNIKLGRQALVHKLLCEMQTVDKLVCVKDNNRTDTYSRVK
jgi:hypothetical protein